MTSVRAGERHYTADAYVVAFGSFSRKLLAPLGIDLPVYPVKGYSITVPIENAAAAPVSTVMDETYKVAITRLGDRIRVGGTAELAGFSAVLSEPRRATLEYSVSNLFPRGRGRAEGQLLDRPAPDDPRRHPDHRPHPVRQSMAEHRPRHARLDHGLRLRPRAGRSHSHRKPEIETADLAFARYGTA